MTEPTAATVIAVSSDPHESLFFAFTHTRTMYVKIAQAKNRIVAMVRPGAVFPVLLCVAPSIVGDATLRYDCIHLSRQGQHYIKSQAAWAATPA